MSLMYYQCRPGSIMYPKVDHKYQPFWHPVLPCLPFTSRVIAKIPTNCLITQEIYTLNDINNFTELIKTVPEYSQGSRAVDF